MSDSEPSEFDNLAFDWPNISKNEIVTWHPVDKKEQKTLKIDIQLLKNDNITYLSKLIGA